MAAVDLNSALTFAQSEQIMPLDHLSHPNIYVLIPLSILCDIFQCGNMISETSTDTTCCF